MKKTISLKVSISGVRGIIGESLTPQLAARSPGFRELCRRGNVMVARTRAPPGR